MTLLALPSPSGDEGAIAEWLQNEAGRVAPGAALTRLGDNLLVVRGNPRAAIFAHTDTTGFTLGYRDALLPIGEPSPHDEEPVRAVVPFPDGTHARGRLRVDEPGEDETYRLENPDAPALPGTRWVYDRPATRDNGTLTAPYLDNRAGVWCALRALERSPNVAVAFSTGEEQHGHGARVCAHWLYANLQITQTLIADMT